MLILKTRRKKITEVTRDYENGAKQKKKYKFDTYTVLVVNP
jgi:hypothetical protein